MARKPQKKRGAFARVAKALLLDIVLIGLGLCVFALFHHVLPTVGVIVVDERSESTVDPSLADALSGLGLMNPTADPALEPTDEQTAEPTAEPSVEPSVESTTEPTPEITDEPVAGQTVAPTIAPTAEPEPEATLTPTIAPAAELSVEPTMEPVIEPTAEPMPEATAEPTLEPSAEPAIESAPEAIAEPTKEPVMELTPAPTPVPTFAPGDFSALFDSVVADTEEVIVTKEEYRSDDVSIRITTNDAGGIRFHVADIYIRNIENLQTAFANDIYGRGQREYAWDISMEKGAILSVNGDYYGARDDGVVIRNGELYRDTLYQDVCVLYKDGEMATYTAEEFDCAAAVERGAWQAWSFGPMLLDEEGEAMKLFNSVVVNHNPRCGVGYYEPGHYCFVIVEGRNDHSRGVTLAEFSFIFEQLGCKTAYNMDGGNTAVMTYGKRLVSEPSQGGRPVTDIIMITEVDGE